MFPIALKNLFQEKTKLAISVGGVAFAVLLIVLLNGLYQGWNKQMGSYVQSLPADLWIAQQGTSDMSHSVSFLPSDLKNKLESISNIDQVNELYGRAFAFKLEGKDKSLYIAGIDPITNFGHPVKMKEGSWSGLRAGQIIIDEAFAHKNNLKVGDPLQIGERRLIISGISTGGNMLIYQYSFVSEDEAVNLFNQKDAVNYYAINIKKGIDIESVKRDITITLGQKVMTKQEFVENNQRVIKESFLPIIAVLDIIGLLIGIAVIGLTIYSATVDKTREYGVMKAIGINNGQLLKIIVWQSLIAGVVGYILGIALSYIVASFAEKFVSEFVTSIRSIDLLWAACATLGMSILASYIPFRRIASINPAEVFKS